MLSATCCISKHIKVKHSLLVTDERRLRTVDARGNPVVDGVYSVRNTGNSFVDMGHPVVDASHSLIDTGHSLIDTGHPLVDTGHSLVNVGHPVVHADNSIIDNMRGIQNFCSHHPSLFICQLV